MPLARSCQSQAEVIDCMSIDLFGSLIARNVAMSSAFDGTRKGQGNIDRRNVTETNLRSVGAPKPAGFQLGVDLHKGSNWVRAPDDGGSFLPLGWLVQRKLRVVERVALSLPCPLCSD